MPKKKYKWIVAEEIPAPGYFKKSKYDDCIDEFLESGLEAAKVNIPEVKPQSLSMLLRMRIKKRGLTDKIKVCIEKDKVYLLRMDKAFIRSSSRIQT